MFALLVVFGSLLPVAAARMQDQAHPHHPAATGSGAFLQVTPIQKVIEMLGEMAAKGKKEKNIEEVEFSKFKTWCEDVISDKTKDIAEAAAAIEQLNADILKAESDAKVLGEEIDAHTADVASYEKELADATAIREQE